MILALVLVLTLGETHRVWAPATYAARTTPSVINISQNLTISINISGGTASQLYTFNVVLTKPLGGGVQSVTTSIFTDPAGSGQGAVTYPNNTPAWTGSGTVNTDLEGLYTISVDKTSPNPVQTGAAATSFSVTHILQVMISSPTGSSFSRGDTVTISASVADYNFRQLASATVTASTPRSTIPLLPTIPTGTYSGQYQIQNNDPTGPWNITVTAQWQAGNRGNSSIIVSVLPAQLVITDLSTYNSYGYSTSDFSPGDTLYAYFRVKYSPNGAFLTTGSFNIQIKNPSGKIVGNLTTIYDQNRGLFYTPSGSPVSSSDQDGSWQLVFQASSLNDAFGNIGPTTTVTYRFQIHNQSAINPFYFLVTALALGGGFSAIFFLRRFNMTDAPFEHLFTLTGGEIQPPATLMIIGDPGAGTSTLGMELLHRDLAAGKHCGLLSYDSFPSEIKRKMRDMGWDITPYLEKGQMEILDCYSALAGVEGAPVRDPTDFTEVSIQVTRLIEGAAKGPSTILLDSVTPIFNSASAKDCINFLQVIGAKIKNNGGMFIFTATRGSIPEEASSKIESLADGVVELSMARRAKSLARFLQVKKISGRQTSSVETGFEIVNGRGILFRKQRVPVSVFQRK